MFEGIFDFFQNDGAAFAAGFCKVWCYIAPVLALLIVIRCIAPMLRFRREPETWGWLVMPDGQQLPVTHWESIIGRSRGCDIIVNVPRVAKNHAVLTRYDDGSWAITDIGSRGTVRVNGEVVSACAVDYGDVISLGEVEMFLAPTTVEEVEEQKISRSYASSISAPGFSLLLLTLFQVFTGLQFLLNGTPESASHCVLGFAALIGIEWLLFTLLKLFHRHSFEVETIAFFLSTLGLSIIASSAPSEMGKQLVCLVGGILIYLIMSWSLRDLSRAKRFRYLAAVGGLALLAANLVLGKVTNGARNWISLGPLSFQPSELVKLCFIYVGASTMDRIVTKRNLFSFIIYSGIICGCLALMNDFGAALIFFAALVVICLLRGGSFSAISLLITVAVCGLLFLVFVDIPPHVKARFATWGHAWEDPTGGGYDQVWSMRCIASGGLFGVGGGNGIFTHRVMAADTDYVFAFICEEWGLIIGILPVLLISIFGIFVARSAAVGRSSFYTIGACAAVTVMMVQAIMNVFGTMDLLPMTGVTFPFVSNGGSSMLASWGLLALVKSADTRQNASLAVKAVKPEEVDLYE